jgi:hypothetical protein
MTFVRVAPKPIVVPKTRRSGRGPITRFERVVPKPSPKEMFRSESPLRPENEHLIGSFIEFNDRLGRYHLATIRGVVEAMPNDYENRFEVEKYICQHFGQGPVVWDDANLSINSYGNSNKGHVGRRQRNAFYRGFFWLVTGMLERDTQVDLEHEGGVWTNTHFLLSPEIFARWISTPAVAPKTF